MMVFNANTHKYAPVFQLGIASLVISFITRLIILIAFSGSMQPGASFAVSFLVGLLYDLVVSAFIILPFVLQITFTSDRVYTRKGMIATVSFFVLLLVILFFTNLLPKEYSKELYRIVEIYVVVRFCIYLFLYRQTHAFRLKWRSAVLQLFIFITLFVLLFNIVSEFVFWQEFSGRYNFIAVDYLVYTHEVVGNITESYPIIRIVTAVAAVTFIIFLFIRKTIAGSVRAPFKFSSRIKFFLVFVTTAVVLAVAVKPSWVNFSSNNYANELAGNGVYQFVQAFKNNELDFYRFYKTIPDTTAFGIVRKDLASGGGQLTADPFSTERLITAALPERKMNVVLISVESLSAGFMDAFGSTKHITPFLDSLADHCLFFTNAYASGTRTVRGLEALALSMPPLPGESIVKRPGNEGLFSLGSVFKNKGYITQFIYGGYGYFDNMNYFFGNNDYEVIDRSSIEPANIHYANIWGVADEDLFTLSLKKMDENYAGGKPFFTQVMTVSNHRPYTYPDGRIDIPSSSHTRDGAVKYTDYAIGSFIKQAASRPWFGNTVFVIIADHCASSAGSTALPVTGYHIPLLIYSPVLPAQKISQLTAQIDVPATILGLLHFSYRSKFFGQDVLDSSRLLNRAFISTYQGLGFISDSVLVVQSPPRSVQLVKPDFITGKAQPAPTDTAVIKKAIAYYQAAAWLFANKKYKK